MLKKKVIIFTIQKCVLLAADLALRPFYRKKRHTWVIGPSQIAGLEVSLHYAVADSRILIINSHRFYENTSAKESGSSYKTWRSRLARVLLPPIWLAWIARVSRGVLFVGKDGYLLSEVDEREFEFDYLRKSGLKIVCLFTGSDIRSLDLMLADSDSPRVESIADYIALGMNFSDRRELESSLKRRCGVVEAYCDQVWNSPHDQKSYLSENSRVFHPFLPVESLNPREEKFMDLTRPIVLHAPSSPLIKGTQLVRAAIRMLHEAGYDFEYVELIERPHSEVLGALDRSHIVLNEFYSFVPGIFGLEALAKKNVLLTRASSRLDPSLPGAPDDAWVPTEPTQIFMTLTNLMERKSDWIEQARRGYSWVQNYGTVGSAGKRFELQLNSVFNEKSKSS